MDIGYIGLGKMGGNMVLRLKEKKYNVVTFDPKESSRDEIQKSGAEIMNSASGVAKALASPRLLWIMVPHQAVDGVLGEITPLLEKNDTIIDGGNSFYKDSMRRAQELAKNGINFLDVGVSGGPHGARNGACMMIGGERKVFNQHERLFRDLSVESGYGYMGTPGAGHFVKMAHNGIEYGMMQSIAEGFSLLKKEQDDFGLDLKKIADVYSNGSVIESRLIGWLKEGFNEYGTGLESVSGTVEHTGEGKWTIETANEHALPVPSMESALEFREQSKQNPSYTGKILTTLRNQFGGHSFKKDQ